MPVIDLSALFLKGLGAAQTAPLGLAVSGGGDSMAMLYLAHQSGLLLQVATVDHGLREGAAAEARMVADVCARLGVLHQTLEWRGWDGQGNIQDTARRARRKLLADWAAQKSLRHIALAHTADDLAEGLLMRLARGAGLDGLAAMQPTWPEAGVAWHRPLLGATRQTLRDYLVASGGVWADDPSNDSDRFERVRVRKALRVLAPLGINASKLAEVSSHLRDARAALDAVTDMASTLFVPHRGTVRFAIAEFAAQPTEIQRRLLQRVLMWISPGDYGPRGGALQRLRLSLVGHQSATLAGCRFVVKNGVVLVFRELKAAGAPVAQNMLWDGRWRIEGPIVDGATIGALTTLGLAQIPDWRASGVARAALLSSPALWVGPRLIAAPCADFGEEWSANAYPGPQGLNSCALSH